MDIKHSQVTLDGDASQNIVGGGTHSPAPNSAARLKKGQAAQLVLDQSQSFHPAPLTHKNNSRLQM